MSWSRSSASNPAIAHAAFLVQVGAISLSGVLAPGPLTAAALAYGLTTSSAGILISLGHGVVEWPIMILIVAGLVGFLRSDRARVALSLLGGLILGWMGLVLLSNLGKAVNGSAYNSRYGPFTTGVILTAANPYFLLWWATIGLKLSSDAWQRGIAVFLAFAVVHWLCDAGWLAALSWASFKGSSLLGPVPQRLILAGSAAIMLIFAAKFCIDAIKALSSLRRT